MHKKRGQLECCPRLVKEPCGSMIAVRQGETCQESLTI